jgi:phage tail sheath protein FI
MSLGRYQTPGIYRQDIFERPLAVLQTGVPVFLGVAARPSESQIQRLMHWQQFVDQFGAPLADSYLGPAVRGFFANDGQLCYVLGLGGSTPADLIAGLAQIAAADMIDLVCAPDIMRPAQPGADLDPRAVRAMQKALLDHCAQQGNRFAILDALPGGDPRGVLAQRTALSGSDGGLYYPWVGIAEGVGQTPRFVPPCGHVAGVFSRSDRATGVHKAPANELLAEVIDLERDLTNADQAGLNHAGVNCIRSFPGRGIRVWGARTLSGESAWTYINVRRLFLTAGRWIERNLIGMSFEPNSPRLWARIERELKGYFQQLYERGALHGASPEEAFYVKCDGETNPLEVRDQGVVATEIGLAPGLPAEFVVVRIIHGASGAMIIGPSQP